MTAIAVIFRRVSERLARNQGIPGNNCLVYFESLPAHGDVYDGNVVVAQIGNERGPWKAKIYLRLAIECADTTQDKALDRLEYLVTEWALCRRTTAQDSTTRQEANDGQ